MENGLDLTLRLAMPVPTVDTDLSLQHTPATFNQGVNVDGSRRVNNGGEASNGRRLGIFGTEVDLHDQGARTNHNVNVRVYNNVFKLFAGHGNTLNFSPHPVQPYAVPPSRNESVLIDVPARRAWRNNNALAIANSNANANATATRGASARRNRLEMVVMRICTNRNCNTNETPMWRKGPLGPKTLCNACGIKYRKEEQRKRANRNN